jgi:hypothetical protein
VRGGNLVQWRRRYDNLGLRFHLDDERLVEGSAVLGEISAAAHRRNSPMIAANAAADNHKIAAQRHGNSVRRNITAACRQLVLVERRLRIRPQEVFLFLVASRYRVRLRADCSAEIPICQNKTENKWFIGARPACW